MIVLAPTRHELRRAVKVVNGTFDALSVEKHPDETFIGRVERGFDILGYHLAPGWLTVARPTLERFLERVARLQEQERCGRSSRAALGSTFGAGCDGRMQDSAAQAWTQPLLGQSDPSSEQEHSEATREHHGEAGYGYGDDEDLRQRVERR